LTDIKTTDHNFNFVTAAIVIITPPMCTIFSNRHQYTLPTSITTLKSVDYNVVMTFRFNNNNNNQLTSTIMLPYTITTGLSTANKHILHVYKTISGKSTQSVVYQYAVCSHMHRSI